MLTKKKFQSGVKSFGALNHLISLAAFALLFVCIFLLCAFLLGFVFFKLPQPLKLTNVATLGALYLSCAVSSFIISKKNGQKYFLCAVLNSTFVVFLLTALSFFGTTRIFSFDFLLRLLSILFCFLGAFLGVKREKIKKHSHRR